MKSDELLSYIFNDTVVLDVDFSTWDQGIRMMVAGWDLPAEGKRAPMFILEFHQVYEFKVSFAHHHVLPEHGHVQWRADEMDQEKNSRGVLFRFNGRSQFPATVIECQRVEVRQLDLEALDRHFPDWGRAGGPLVRPGIEELIRLGCILPKSDRFAYLEGYGDDEEDDEEE